MSGERALLNTAIGRTAAVLLTAALAFVLAPVAAATPESDAADAINQTYDASGGTTGPMGPSDGGFYPIGGGFGQNFAGGKIFFTPDTGAHIMGGAILEKYESLGGAADGDLGFRPSTRVLAWSARTAATPRSAPRTSPLSSGHPTPAPMSSAER